MQESLKEVETVAVAIIYSMQVSEEGTELRLC
jgi:hypothetical protein